MYWLPKHLSAGRILAIGVSGKAEGCQTKVWGRDLKYIIGVISKKVNPNVVDHHLAQEADITDNFIPLLVSKSICDPEHPAADAGRKQAVPMFQLSP